MVKIGIVGIGFMGVTHFKALQKVRGAKVAAVCTRDETKLAGDWRRIKGNFGDSGGMQDLSKVSRYRALDELLADDSIDLVDICLPTHLHRETAIAALQAGKHVLVEKPLALNLRDADAMIAAAQKAGRLLMVGQVLRFFPAFAEARAIAHEGKFGRLLGANFKRIITRPAWAVDDHFADVSKSGGPALDLHIHDTDFVLYLAGVPARVQAAGLVARNGDISYLNSQYLYDGENAPCISAQSGAIAMRAVSFEHGFDLYLERATLRFNNLQTGQELWLHDEQGKTKKYQPRRAEAFQAQLQHAVECVKTNQQSKLISAAGARTALAVCLLEQKAVLSGKAVPVKI